MMAADGDLAIEEEDVAFEGIAVAGVPGRDVEGGASENIVACPQKLGPLEM
jgi:hypothetical protein